MELLEALLSWTQSDVVRRQSTGSHRRQAEPTAVAKCHAGGCCPPVHSKRSGQTLSAAGTDSVRSDQRGRLTGHPPLILPRCPWQPFPAGHSDRVPVVVYWVRVFQVLPCLLPCQC